MAIAVGLLKMLVELQQTRKTGALEVHGPGARVRLFIEGGKVVFADEGTLGETLGRILVRERVLTQDQYNASIDRIADLLARGKKAKLGEVFVELGFLTPEQVHAALAAQVQQKVMRALVWANARCSFVESHGPLDVGGNFPTPVEPLFVSALRLADREHVDELLVQAGRRFVGLRVDRAPGGGATKLEALARIDAFQLSAAEDAFARALDGSRTLDELLEEDAGGVDRRAIVAALLLTDALDLHPQSIAPRPAGKPQPQTSKPVPPRPPSKPLPPRLAERGARSEPRISGVSGAQPLTVRTTSIRVPAKGSVRPNAPEERAHAKQVAGRIRSAQEAKKAQVAPEFDGDVPDTLVIDPTTPLERMAPVLAEQAYQAGKKLVRGHRLAEAVLELQRAAALHPATEYTLWATWAEARSDPEGETSHVDRLRAAAQLAIEQDTERGFASFVLAHLARRAGDAARASALLARARELDPESVVDAWDVRLRIGPAASSPPRGEIRALAPLLTRSSSPPPPKPAVPVAAAPVVAAPDVDPPDSGPELAKLDADWDDAAVQHAGEPDTDRDPEPEPEPDTEPEPEPEPEPDHEHAREHHHNHPHHHPTTTSSSPRRGFLVFALVVLALAAGAGFVFRATPQDDGAARPSASHAVASPVPPVPTEPPSAAPSAAPEPEAVASTDGSVSAVTPTVTVDASADASVDASYESGDAGLPAIDPMKGLLVLPPAADTHRVYIDGRMVGVPPPPISVVCGIHVVKIGSQGREQTVSVPCGGNVSVEYP